MGHRICAAYLDFKQLPTKIRFKFFKKRKFCGKLEQMPTKAYFYRTVEIVIL